MRVLKNYKVLKETIEEFPLIKLKQDEDVFVDLPLCTVPYGVEFETPVLFYTQQTQIPEVVEKAEIEEKIKGTKLFYFKILEGDKVEEVSPKDADFSYRLPEETPVKNLAIINGELGLLDPNS